MANIGIDIRLLGVKHGGIGRYTQELLLGLLSLQTEHCFTCFYNKDLEAEPVFVQLQKHSQVKLVECNIRHYSWREQWHLANIIDKEKLDLIHFPNFNVPIKLKTPFVVTIHDMVHHKISGAKKSKLIYFLAYKKVIESAAKNAKKIITVSEVSKKEISEYLNVPMDKIFVTYEGASLETEVTEDDLTSVKNKYYLRRPYFLFVGVLERKKNIVGLTRAFDYFIEKYHADMDLVLAGKVDPHYPKIKHSALDIKNRNRLVFTDYVSEKDLSALFYGASAFVSASVNEGFGLPGLEAMKFGLPLLVSNTPVFNEIYDNAAIYFNALDTKDIAKAMDLVSKDAKFQEEISRKSFQRSQFFSWEKCAQETLALYNKTLAKQ